MQSSYGAARLALTDCLPPWVTPKDITITIINPGPVGLPVVCTQYVHMHVRIETAQRMKDARLLPGLRHINSRTSSASASVYVQFDSRHLSMFVHHCFSLAYVRGIEASPICTYIFILHNILSL